MTKRDPLIKSLFQNLVITDLIKERTNKGLQPNLYLLRDRNDFKIDILYKKITLLYLLRSNLPQHSTSSTIL